MKTMELHSREKEKDFLITLHREAFLSVLRDFVAYGRMNDASLYTLMAPLSAFLETRYFDALEKSFMLARHARDASCFDAKRVAHLNPTMSAYKRSLLAHFPAAGNIWVLNGLVFANQTAGLKNLAGFTGEEGLVIDVLNSASSLSLGAENPWLVAMDYAEDILGVRDNICAAYHPGVRQTFALERLTDLYPNKQVHDLVVHMESSGTVVDSIAIESVVAYSEKYHHGKTAKKVLAVDGTWAGGYGAAREGTGFGVNNFQKQRTGKTLWVDRCLPAPTKQNADVFLSVLSQRLKRREVAGLYIEPDVVGDLGLVSVDQVLLQSVKNLMAEAHLPIIVDCVQQLGRSGSYWGENVDQILADYPLLVLTTAKSASNGQPFGFVIMPKVVADAAHPLSQITTNQMNGPLLRSLVVARVLSNEMFQRWLREKSADIDRVADRFGWGDKLRGKYLNRGIYLASNDDVKLAQIALLVEDRILVGATPHTIRYQPMTLEYSQTNIFVAEAIFRRLQRIESGDISPAVRQIFEKMQGMPSGLGR